jgi:F-type H+-transporting ATPase subunit delta
MRNTILAQRYAKALFGLAKDAGEQENVFNQMRAMNEAFTADEQIQNFLTTPMIRPGDKVKAIEGMLASLKISDILKNFVLLLARKRRLGIFAEVVGAYQLISDESHGVTRGQVRSAAVLGPDDRKRIEELVSKATSKKVILTYKEDPTLLGGLVAEVGSFTFDDSLLSHLSRINEQLTRSMN